MVRTFQLLFTLLCIHAATAVIWEEASDAFWAPACDFLSHDIGSDRTAADRCGATCQANPSCTHFVWTLYDGGTCWMKRKVGVTKADAFDSSQPSAVCGIIKRSSTDEEDKGCDICSGAYSGSHVIITNNLGYTVDILTNAGMFGGCTWDGSKVPPCLRGLSPTQSRSITLANHFGWSQNWGYNFATANPGSLFEITPGNMDSLDYYDISYNAGYNVPITVLAPDSALHVATSVNAPDVYPAGAETCGQVQPCASATYASHKGVFKVYFGNRSGDVNSPGPCGCTPCPGFDCSGHQGQPLCTTSGSNLWCWQNGPGTPHCPICGSACPSHC